MIIQRFDRATLRLNRIDHDNNRWMCRRAHLVGPVQVENLTVLLLIMAMREKMFDNRFDLIHPLYFVREDGGVSRIAGIGRDRIDRRPGWNGCGCPGFCRMIVNGVSSVGDEGWAGLSLTLDVTIHLLNRFWSVRS